MRNDFEREDEGRGEKGTMNLQRIEG